MENEEKQIVCKVCGGRPFSLRQKICECLVGSRIRGYLKPLGNLEPLSKELIKILSGVSVKENLYLKSNSRHTDEIMSIFAYLLLRGGLRRTYKILNIYELIEIFLGEHSFSRSVLRLPADVIIFLSGFGEMKNKRQQELVVQSLESRRIRNKKTWFYSAKGNVIIYPEIDEYLNRNSFEKVDLFDAHGESAATRL